MSAEAGSKAVLLHIEALRPNKPLQRTPLRVEQDRGVFEGWIRPDTSTDL
jgi:hypothetical protein